MQSVITQKQQALTQEMTDHTAPTLLIINIIYNITNYNLYKTLS